MTDPSNITLTIYAQTDVGMMRAGNEDNFLVADLSTGQSWTGSDTPNAALCEYEQGYYGALLAVSDGLGGTVAGADASRLAVETVRDRMLQLQAHPLYRQIPFHERLRLAIEEANLLINDESIHNYERRGLGATFTAAAAQGDRIYFAQVGDSRAYLIRHGKIIRITKDQSLVQQLVDAGQVTEEEAETHSYRNVILQCLGAHTTVSVEINSLKLCRSDTFVLCSDGLSGKVRADEIVKVVKSASDLNNTCQSLISLANERGGEDNITVVIVRFTGAGLPTPSSDPIKPEVLLRQSGTPTELSWDAETAADTDPMNDRGSTEELSDHKSGEADTIPAPPSVGFPTSSNLPRHGRVLGSPRSTEQIGSTEPTTAVFRNSDAEEFWNKRKRLAGGLVEKQSEPSMPSESDPEPVLLGASAPQKVRPGEEFTAFFTAYIKAFEDQVEKQLRALSPRATPHLGVKNCRWQKGTKVKIKLYGNQILVNNPEEEFVWNGTNILVDFDITIPPDAPHLTTVLKYDVLISGIVIARLRIDLDICSEPSEKAYQTAKIEPARTAFASYASADRKRVLDRVSEVQKNGVDVFLDCLSLNPGEVWKATIEKEIEKRELFLLFWSINAKRSPWVTWEWQTALRCKGLSGIDPHPLDPVHDAEPPLELAQLHFGDPYMLIRKTGTTRLETIFSFSGIMRWLRSLISSV